MGYALLQPNSTVPGSLRVPLITKARALACPELSGAEYQKFSRFPCYLAVRDCQKLWPYQRPVNTSSKELRPIQSSPSKIFSQRGVLRRMDVTGR